MKNRIMTNIYAINKNILYKEYEDKLYLFDTQRLVLYTPNEVASFILRQMEKPISIDSLQKKILKNFSCNEKDIIQKDLETLINKLEKKKLIKKTITQ